MLERGSTVYVEGRLTLNRWRGQDGTEKSGLNLSASRCDVLGAVGHRPGPRPARVEQGARPVLRPSADGQPSIGRPADGEPPLESYGEPASDDLPIDFDEPQTPRLIRERIAAAAAAQKSDMPYGWERTLKKAEGNPERRKRLLEDHEILEPLVNRLRAPQREVSP